jgi:hypothetical protein
MWQADYIMWVLPGHRNIICSSAVTHPQPFPKHTSSKSLSLSLALSDISSAVGTLALTFSSPKVWPKHWLPYFPPYCPPYPPFWQPPGAHLHHSCFFSSFFFLSVPLFTTAFFCFQVANTIILFGQVWME